MIDKNRVYQLDLFRFLAALSIVFFHYFFRGYAQGNMSNLNFNVLGHIFKYGYLGVNLFFIISGFVIPISIQHKSLSKFITSRISRLYPTYWVSAFLTFIITILFGAPRFTAELKQLIINLSMFQNYIGAKNIDEVYWTLFIEMKFYLFIIAPYLLINKLKHFKLDYLIYFWTVLSVLYLFKKDISIIQRVDYWLILSWSSYFISGLLFFKIYSEKIKFKYIALLIISLSLSLHHSLSRAKIFEVYYNTTLNPSIVGLIIISFYILLFLVSINKLKLINSPNIFTLGSLTYPLYLMHQNIGFIAFNNLSEHLNKYILVTSVIIFMIITSYLLSKFYEPVASTFLKTKIKNKIHFFL